MPLIVRGRAASTSFDSSFAPVSLSGGFHGPDPSGRIRAVQRAADRRQDLRNLCAFRAPGPTGGYAGSWDLSAFLTRTETFVQRLITRQ